MGLTLLSPPRHRMHKPFCAASFAVVFPDPEIFISLFVLKGAAFKAPTHLQKEGAGRESTKHVHLEPYNYVVG